MSWCSDDGTHEGYIVGLVRDEKHGTFVGHNEGRWRELDVRDIQPVPRLTHVRVACACGWRSPLIWGTGCAFTPSVVHAPSTVEDAARELWKFHVRESGTAPDAGYDIYTLLERVRRALP